MLVLLFELALLFGLIAGLKHEVPVALGPQRHREDSTNFIFTRHSSLHLDSPVSGPSGPSIHTASRRTRLRGIRIVWEVAPMLVTPHPPHAGSSAMAIALHLSS